MLVKIVMLCGGGAPCSKWRGGSYFIGYYYRQHIDMVNAKFYDEFSNRNTLLLPYCRALFQFLMLLNDNAEISPLLYLHLWPQWLMLVCCELPASTFSALKKRERE